MKYLHPINSLVFTLTMVTLSLVETLVCFNTLALKF